MRGVTLILCLSLLLTSVWTRPSPSDPDNRCGRSDRSLKPYSRITLMRGGDNSTRGFFPWMAALYFRINGHRWEQICGGTLIASRLVLTAAHCFYFDRPLNAEDLQVGLGKVFISYDQDEPNSVISSFTHKMDTDLNVEPENVQELILPDKYVGGENYYEMDIALLVLSKNVANNDYIMPACVDWDEFWRVEHEDIGYLAGWGSTDQEGTPSPVLKWASQRYIEYETCKDMIAPEDIKLITQDKLCVAEDSGAVGKQGDSGGGLTMIREDAHHVYGILSTKLSNESLQTNVRLFTNVTNDGHIAWLKHHYKRFYSEEFKEKKGGLIFNENFCLHTLVLIPPITCRSDQRCCGYYNNKCCPLEKSTRLMTCPGTINKIEPVVCRRDEVCCGTDKVRCCEDNRALLQPK